MRSVGPHAQANALSAPDWRVPRRPSSARPSARSFHRSPLWPFTCFIHRWPPFAACASRHATFCIYTGESTHMYTGASFRSAAGSVLGVVAAAAAAAVALVLAVDEAAELAALAAAGSTPTKCSLTCPHTSAATSSSRSTKTRSLTM